MCMWPYFCTLYPHLRTHTQTEMLITKQKGQVQEICHLGFHHCPTFIAAAIQKKF